MTRQEEIKIAAYEYGVLNAKFEIYQEDPAFIAGAEWADGHPQSPWISVEDRLPTKSGEYNVRFSDGTYWSDFYDAELRTWDKEKVEKLKITHWMSIPK